MQHPPSLALEPANLSSGFQEEPELNAQTESQAETTSSTETRALQLGLASFQESYGVAQLAAASRARQQAKHLYTNLDVERMNQMTGMVKYRDKTEQVE